MTKLETKEEMVLRMRFGIENDNPMTLEEIGESFGITRERVRQIEQKALNKLKHPIHALQLESLL